jgi:uncharacterized protein with PQ loop repeat
MIEFIRTLAYTVLPTLATIFITITYLPQIYKTHKTKKVDDLALGFWVLLNLFLVCMWTNSLFAWIDSGNLGYFITETINWALAIVVLVQILIYRKKNKKS